MEKIINKKLLEKYPDIYKHLSDLVQLETKDNKKIYIKDNHTYYIDIDIFNYWYNNITSKNTYLMFTLTLDPKFIGFSKNNDHQKLLIDNAISKIISQQYIYTYELQKNKNIHIHGFIMDTKITPYEVTNIKSKIRKELQNPSEYNKKSNRLIHIEKVKNIEKAICYCLKDLDTAPYTFRKKLYLSANSHKKSETSKIKYCKDIERKPQLSLRSEDCSDCITVSFD